MRSPGLEGPRQVAATSSEQASQHRRDLPVTLSEPHLGAGHRSSGQPQSSPGTEAHVAAAGVLAVPSDHVVASRFSQTAELDDEGTDHKELGDRKIPAHSPGLFARKNSKKFGADFSEVCGKMGSIGMENGTLGEHTIIDRQELPFAFDSDPDSSINKLLHLLRSHPNRKTAVAAALKAVETTPEHTENGQAAAAQAGSEPTSTVNGAPQPQSGTDAAAGASQQAQHRSASPQKKEEEPVPDLSQVLQSYPKCNHLIETFRNSPNTQNKTPLAVLHEYSTRLSLELAYNESADTNLGPFHVEARLTSVGGAVLYATGSGKGRGKKDAKQGAAAAVLEMLLANVSESDFLQPGKAKQQKQQPMMLADGGVFGRMRGGRGMRGMRGVGRGPGRLGPQGRLGMGMDLGLGQIPPRGPFTPGPRAPAPFLPQQRMETAHNILGVGQAMGMPGAFGNSSPFRDLPGQKRNFSSTVNMDMLGGQQHHSVNAIGMGGVAPLGPMLEEPAAFPSNIQDIGLASNLYGQAPPTSYHGGMDPGGQGQFDLSQGLDSMPMQGGFPQGMPQGMPSADAFPRGPPQQNYVQNFVPGQFQQLGPNY